MINPRVLDILASVSNDEADSIPEWQQQRISQLEQVWYASFLRGNLEAACNVLESPGHDDVSACILSYLLAVAEYFWVAGWHSNEGFLTIPAETRQQFEAAMREAEKAFERATWPFVESNWSKWHEMIYFGAQCQWESGSNYQEYLAWEAMLAHTSGHAREAHEVSNLRIDVERELTRRMFQEGFLDYAALAGDASLRNATQIRSVLL